MGSKSNFSDITTKRYALALYELSKENSELGRIETESKSIQELFQHSPEFRNLIKDPTNNKNEQMNAIKKISSRNTISVIDDILKSALTLFLLLNPIIHYDVKYQGNL